MGRPETVGQHRFQLKAESIRTASANAIRTWALCATPFDNLGAMMPVKELIGLMTFSFDLIIPGAQTIWTQTIARSDEQSGDLLSATRYQPTIQRFPNPSMPAVVASIQTTTARSTPRVQFTTSRASGSYSDVLQHGRGSHDLRRRGGPSVWEPRNPIAQALAIFDPRVVGVSLGTRDTDELRSRIAWDDNHSDDAVMRRAPSRSLRPPT